MALMDIFNIFAKREQPEMGETALADIFGSGLFGNGESFTVYNPSALVTREGLRVFDQMKTDEQVKAAMAFKQGTVTASGWELISPEGENEDWDVLQFVNDQLNCLGEPGGEVYRSRGGLTDKVTEILSALEYGFSITEKVWDEDDGRIVLKDMKTRAPHDWEFELDQHGNVTAIRQFLKVLPVHKFVIYTYDAEFQNPYGRSDLESAYRAWWTKNNSLRWLSMFLEKHGIPPIFALYDPNSLDAEGQSRLRTIMKRIQAATVGMVPKPKDGGLEMWSPTISDNVQSIFIPAIDKFDNMISKAILMPGLLGFTSDESTGSLARSQTHFDVFMLVVQKLRRDTAQIIQNEIVKEIVDYNFDTGGVYPIFQWKPFSDGVSDTILSRWRELLGVKAVHTQQEDERHLRDIMGFPPMSEETEKEWEPADDEPTDDPNDDGSDKDDVQEDDPEKDDGEEIDDGDPDGDDDELDPEEVDEQLAAYFALGRAPNRYEKKVDFTFVVKELNQIEGEALDLLTESMKKVRDRHIKFIRANFKPEQTWIRNIQLHGMKEFELQLEQALRKNLEFGQARVRSELPVELSERGPAFLPSEALSEMKTRALDKSTTIKGRLVDGVKRVLMNGVANGEGVEDMIPKIEKEFRPYVGNPNVLKDGAPLSKFLLENVVRTESTRAFNRGRLVEMRSDKARQFVEAVQYSAIIDDRTTDVCQELDQKIFRLNTDDLTGLTPPNHYMCRSVLVPIMIDEPIDEKDIITPAQIGKGKDLAGEGFV